MIANVRFYRMKGGLSSGEYPLFTVGQDLSSKLVATVSRKVMKDIHQTIEVPEFTGYESCNICEIDGLFYWITSFAQSTIVNGSIEFTLDLMAPTSFLKNGVYVTGSWHKLPRNVCPYLKAEITNDIMTMKSRIGTVGNVITPTAGKKHPFWWQVSGFKQDGTIAIYGGFANWNEAGYSERIAVASGGPWYPSINDMLKGLGAFTPLTAQTVIDVSVSFRCPYAFDVSTSGTTDIYKLKQSATVLEPAVYGTDSTFKCYEIIDNAVTSGGVSISIDTIETAQSISVDTLTASCGQISVRDWNNNSIMDIPTQLAVSGQIPVTVKTISEMNGVYTLIKAGDSQILIPEGHIPFLSNNWETYRAYSLDTDRQAMENAIRFAEYNRDTQRIVGTANSAINGAISGLMTGFVSGAGPAAVALGAAGAVGGALTDIFGQDRNMELSRMQIQADFDLTQKRAINQPQTAYNTAYGLQYLYMNMVKPLSFDTFLPKNMSSSYFNAWIGQYGYPAEGVRSAIMEPGYYQGSILNDGSLSGMYFDELNKDFMQGFRFINIG